MFASGALPARLPADLLGRRPDIVAARLRVEAAFANADSTRAQFYPDVNLVALGGVFALTPASLFSRDALAGSIGPAISLPIFDRGRLKAKLGADVAQADVAIGLYNKTVDDALGQARSSSRRCRRRRHSSRSSRTRSRPRRRSLRSQPTGTGAAC